MGEAKRKQLAGYVPQVKEVANPPVVVGFGRRTMGLARAALLAYPSLPNWPKGSVTTE